MRVEGKTRPYLEFEIWPVEYEQGRQNRQVNEDANGALVIQMLECAIPEK